MCYDDVLQRSVYAVRIRCLLNGFEVITANQAKLIHAYKYTKRPILNVHASTYFIKSCKYKNLPLKIPNLK
jgi:hypothetical protein